MKVLIMNDKLLTGGTEQQCLRENELLRSHGHEVYSLTFDINFPSDHSFYNEENNFFNIPLRINKLTGVYWKMFCDYSLLHKIRNALEKIKPDIIHVNNLNLAPITQYRSLKGYNAIQTVRDYGAVCRKYTCIYEDKEVCSGFKNNNCLKMCGKNKIISAIKLIKMKRVVLLRKKYIKCYITPSQMLAGYCKNNGYKNVVCINDCFDFAKVDQFSKKVDFDNKIYLYFGLVDEIKGIFEFLKVFNEFSYGKSIKLYIAGKAEGQNLERLKSLIDTNESIEYLGLLKHEDILKLLQETYAVVVPSLWMENYPNTVLEGMATGCLVLGSDRGGIPEMVDGRGVIFNIMDDEDIKGALNKSYNMSKEEYYNITKSSKEYVLSNNNTFVYYSKLLRLFEGNIVK